jgi:hypothetical protein
MLTEQRKGSRGGEISPIPTKTRTLVLFLKTHLEGHRPGLKVLVTPGHLHFSTQSELPERIALLLKSTILKQKYMEVHGKVKGWILTAKVIPDPGRVR